MKLIGMLDSPYVRRVAISLQLLGLRFEHQSLSVFRTFEQFRAINPAVKAPTLVCDDGTVLMDSTLILAYAEAMARAAGAGRSLVPADLPGLQRDLHLLGFTLAACEKSVQLVYERGLRPAEKQHAPWLERVSQQLLGACDTLEAALAGTPRTADPATLTQGGLMLAVTWEFIQQMVPADVPAARYPRLAAFSAQAEALAEFRAAPHGDGTFPVTGR